MISSDLEIEASDDAIRFCCPDSMYPHCVKVFQGEYAAPGIDLGPAPTILDIGACIGAFSLWASQTYPGGEVYAYEPNPEAYSLLLQNTKIPSRCFNVAVCIGGPKRNLFKGKNNLGEASLFRGQEQTDEVSIVTCFSPSELPPCDFLKVDTEGCEHDIIAGVLREPCNPPKVIAFEFHSADDRIRLDKLLTLSVYTLIRGEISRPDRGVLVYARL